MLELRRSGSWDWLLLLLLGLIVLWVVPGESDDKRSRRAVVLGKHGRNKSKIFGWGVWLGPAAWGECVLAANVVLSWWVCEQ